jgi:N6-adenosine-specific RNA methylase IME4
MMGIGSTQLHTNGSMLFSRQNAPHRVQCASNALARSSVTLALIFSWTRLRKLRKSFHFGVGTVAKALSVGMQFQNET